jgi:hypothetical protein
VEEPQQEAVLAEPHGEMSAASFVPSSSKMMS